MIARPRRLDHDPQLLPDAHLNRTDAADLSFSSIRLTYVSSSCLHRPLGNQRTSTASCNPAGIRKDVLFVH